MKILHLITDHQVIERTLGIYEEVFPGCNDVLVFGKDRKSFKRLKNDYTGKIVNYGNLKEIVSKYDFSDITHVISHYMSMDKIDFIKMIPENIHVCWEIYGFDLYNQFLEPMGYKNHYTNPVLYGKRPFFRKNFGGLLRVLSTVKSILLGRNSSYLLKCQKKKQFDYICNRINSIQYCCGYDAKFVRDYIKRDIPSYEIFNYSLDEVLGELRGAAFIEGKDILIGNSASFSNNHLYVLNYLQKIDIPEDARIIMPLSYGGIGKYADDVERIYKKAYPTQLKTLRSYIPLHEYNKMFLGLKAMFLPAWRQEQQGTAIMGFYFGVKVFMAERNPLYKWFVDCGFIVFSFETMTSEDLNTPLTLEEKLHNRQLVDVHYSDEGFKERLRSNII